MANGMGQRQSCVALLREKAKRDTKRAEGCEKLADLLDNILETGSVEEETLWIC